MSSTYGYDLLNRLVACSGTCASASYAYDAFGNRSGGTLVAGTHRLGSIGSSVFSYDANGQLLSDGASTVGWTSFGQPSFIAGPGNSPRIDFRYGVDRQRTVEQVSNGPTILYVGNQFFEYRTAPAVSGRAYIHSPDGVIATVVLAANADTYTDKSWFKDHLGSVSVERDGAANAYAAFDEWGARRGTYIPGATSRGFTGHEHLDAFSLVRMNGRIYSPDPVVHPWQPLQSSRRHGAEAEVVPPFDLVFVLPL